MIQFDCHAHVYEKVAVTDGARYVPKEPAPLSDWLSHGREQGMVGGVIVQVSFLGFDNSELVSALAKLDRSRFAGVAVVPLGVSEGELDQLCAAGIRGVRWNLVHGAAIPDLRNPSVQTFLGRIMARNLHLEIHLESPYLAKITPELLSFGVTLVVDHFGLPSLPDPKNDPWLKSLSRIDDLSAVFVKFSGHYRTAFDVRPHADTLLSLLPPGHVVWGSDWPHTQHEGRINYDMVAAMRSEWAVPSDLSTANRLYGISALV